MNSLEIFDEYYSKSMAYLACILGFTTFYFSALVNVVYLDNIWIKLFLFTWFELFGIVIHVIGLLYFYKKINPEKLAIIKPIAIILLLVSVLLYRLPSYTQIQNEQIYSVMYFTGVVLSVYFIFVLLLLYNNKILNIITVESNTENK